MMTNRNERNDQRDRTGHLRHNRAMMNVLLLLRRRSLAVFALALIVATIGTAGGNRGTLIAQGQHPCGLLTMDEVQALVPKVHVDAGVATSIPSVDFFACHYTWGAGATRSTLAVSVNSASRMYAGLNADAIRQGLTSSIVAATSDQTIPDVGQAAVFKNYSAAYVGASAYVKDRILQISLDGDVAPAMKGQLISLLKSAASRL